jgi:sugar (pentulose or hexulose) kinase
VVEGLAFAARRNIELLQKAAQNGSVQSIRLAGGMSKSTFFAQLLADVLGVPVEAAQVPECSALGAAICAAVGARLYDDSVIYREDPRGREYLWIGGAASSVARAAPAREPQCRHG